MADEKLNTGPAENISPEAAEPIATPEQAAASEPQQEQTGPAIPEPGDVVVSFDKINELMAEKRQNARAEVEKAETPEAPEAAAPGETPQPANTEEPKKPRRGRPPKAEKAATENQKAEKSAGARKGRPPKADKAAPDKPKPSKRDKVSRSDGKAPDAKEPIKPAQDTALKETAAVEQTAPEPTTPPRPVEEGKLVYLKLSEVHPFHTFRPHPFKVRDDAKMQEIVASIRVNGVMVPGLARPEKDGNGYEIVAGHRRTHGSELAGLEEMPFIVREMTDHEAVQAMPMQTINLKQYYPFCKEDIFVEVSDEIVEAFLLDKRAEAARDRKMFRYKAFYSLDCNDGIENAAIGWAQPSPEDYLIEKEELAEYEELIRRLYEAISSLPPMQARRVHARYMLGMKVKDIAAMEGITPSQAGKSIHAALRRLRRYFARQKWTVNL